MERGTILDSVVSSPLDCSNRFTLHPLPLVDLFIPTSAILHRETFSHADIYDNCCAHTILSIYNESVSEGLDIYALNIVLLLIM